MQPELFVEAFDGGVVVAGVLGWIPAIVPVEAVDVVAADNVPGDVVDGLVGVGVAGVEEVTLADVFLADGVFAEVLGVSIEDVAGLRRRLVRRPDVVTDDPAVDLDAGGAVWQALMISARASKLVAMLVVRGS